MTKKNADKQLMPLLTGAVNACVANPIILFPFVTAAFIQLFILEILYFSPRFPLSTFFGPIIRTFWSDSDSQLIPTGVSRRAHNRLMIS